jgi:hypothetical protein
MAIHDTARLLFEHTSPAVEKFVGMNRDYVSTAVGTLACIFRMNRD